MRDASPFVGPGILLGCALSLAGYGLAHPTVTVAIPRDGIQRAVEVGLPVLRQRAGTSHSLDAVKVDLRADGGVRAAATTTSSAASRRVELAMAGSGTLAYGDGAFRVEGFRVLWSVPGTIDDPLSDVEAPAGGAIGEAAGRLGIGGAGSLLSARRETILAEARENGAGLLTDLVQGRPVHLLKATDTRQSPSDLALRDVRVEGDTALADLNVLGLLGHLALYGAALTLAVAGSAWLALALGIRAAFPYRIAVATTG